MLAVGEEDLCIFTKVSMTDKGFHALCLKKHSEYSRVGHDAIIGIKPFAVSRSKSFTCFVWRCIVIPVADKYILFRVPSASFASSVIESCKNPST